MKKVININFQGVVVPIEEDAYEIIKQYINDLRAYFEREEGREEIINDIESRIGELFQSKIKEGAACITEADAEKIIDNMGRVKDFEEAGLGDDDSSENQKESSNAREEKKSDWRSKRLYRNTNDRILGGVCSGIADYIGIDPWIVRILFIITGIGLLAYIILWIFLPTGNEINTTVRKKFYRNPDDKIIGGVSGGIGSYFNINPWIPRIIFLIPFIRIFRLSWVNWQYDWAWGVFPNMGKVFFSPTLILIYIILWIVIPEAKTTSEKLQMRGEKVDLNSIKESVSKELNQAGESIKKAGNDAKAFFKNKSQPTSGEKKRYNKGSSGISTLGQIIVTLIKVFIYIIAGAIIFALLLSLFAVSIAGVAVFPLKNFIIPAGIPDLLAWASLILLVLIPVVALITYIIAKLARRQSVSPIIRNVGLGSFVLGIFAAGALTYSVKREFRNISDEIEKNIRLTDPNVEMIDIQPIKIKNIHQKSFKNLNGISWLTADMDSILISNVKLRIFKSPTDEFMVKYVALSNGYSRETANEQAEKIKVNGLQQGNTLFLSNTITINKKDQFRNQMIEMMVYVPVGHQFRVDRSFDHGMGPDIYFRNGRNFPDNTIQYSGYGYSRGVTYVMNEDGPERVSATNESDTSLSDKRSKIDSLKTEQQKKLEEMDRAIDSIRKAKEAIE